MVQNAKEYNMPKSPIVNDAERVRKMAFNFMKQNNPAYKDPNYVAIATPVPDAPTEKTTKLRLNAPSKALPTANAAGKSSSGSPTIGTPSGSEPIKPKGVVPFVTSTKTEDEKPRVPGVGKDFKSMSFQEAQEKILMDLIEYVEPDSGLKIFEPFVQLPSRKLRDYYMVIKQPVSLKQILKRVHGWHSRDEQTGVTDFRSWDAFEHEVARVWDNARKYNEDGSEMYQLAGELEQEFKRRLNEAKESVEEPAQPKIKLNMGDARQPSSGLKLKLGSQKQSPAPITNSVKQPGSGSPPLSAGQSASNGTPAAQPKPPSVRPGSSQARSTGSPALSVKTPNGVTAPPLSQPQVNGSMPPPSLTARPPSSNSSYPSTQQPPSSQQGQQTYVPQPFNQPPNSFDSKWRPRPRTSPDGSSSFSPDILMSKLHVATHPDLSVPRPLRLAIPADKLLSQQSITTSVSSQHTTLRLTADLADQLRGPNARAYRLFVFSNGIAQSQRVIKDYSQLPAGMVNGVNGTVDAATTLQKDHGPSWDVRLSAGTNRIEVECVAAAKQGSGSSDLVKEKVSLFVFQMKG